MADLTDFQVTDLVDDVTADRFNALLAAVLRSQYANTETLSATKELVDGDCQFQILTPSGSDQTVELPEPAVTNHVTVIFNPTGTSYDILVKDYTGSTTYVTLAAGESAMFVSSGAEWKQVGSSGVSVDAANVTYTPNDNTDWNSSADPGDTNDALDQLAARLKTAEGDFDAATITYTPNTAADWNSSADPGDTNDALDQLASRTTTLEGHESIVQEVYAEYAIYSSGAGTFPKDNSIPQNTEGNEIITVNITPTSATNKLRVSAFFVGTASAQAHIAAAIFKDSTADALAANATIPLVADALVLVPVYYEMTAGGTSQITFKLRAGSSSGTTYYNGDSSSRLYGGVLKCWIKVEEIKQ